MRAELPLAEPEAELSHAAGKGLRLAAREIAPEHAHHRSALEEREVQRQLGDLAGGEADHEQPSAPGDGAERRLAVGAADRVVDDVNPLSPGQAFDALAKIFGGVVDGRVGAVLAAHRELLVARGAGDDARAERLADLDRGKADSAGR